MDITLRDYLAAHVTEPVPTDFEPVPWHPVEYPPTPPDVPANEAGDIRRWDTPEGLSAAGAAYWRACRDVYAARAEAMRAAEVARLARWRYAFADAMMAARRA